MPRDSKETKNQLITIDDIKNAEKPRYRKGMLFSAIITTICVLGEAVIDILKFLFIRIGKLFARFGRFAWRSTLSLRRVINDGLKYLGCLIASPFVKASKSFQNLRESVKTAKREKGFWSALRIILRSVYNFFFGKYGIAGTVFNWAAPIISIVFLFNIVTYATSVNYAVKLTVNGQFLGYIENEQVFNDAELITQQRLNYIGSKTSIESIPEYSIEKIGYSDTLSKYQVADLILQNSGISIEYAYGFYINDVFYGAVIDNQSIIDTLDGLLDVYRTTNPDEEVAFVDSIDYERTGLYLSDSIVDPQEIISRITGYKTVAHYYSVEYGDSHTLIGDKLDMTQAEIEALNPGFIDNDLHVGDQIMMNMDEPILAVSITRTENYDENVDFETEYYDDSAYYVGVSQVTRAGIYGVNNVTARVTYVNGYETKRTVIDSKIISLPESQLVAQGTKPTPQGTYSTDTATYGKFIWPVNGGYISEYTVWDGGYYNHFGIDIAAPYGTAIYAGASGVVTMASNGYYGYGKCIIIQHENGLSTLYGHCSSLYVTVGETVTMGQCIAAVGQTGYAFGNHLHFEVRNGSTKYNPVAFLDL